MMGNLLSASANYFAGRCLSSPASPLPKPEVSHLSMAATARIAVVGDVHDDWNLEEDSKALQFLQPDLVLFTGDFGNENVELVRSIAELQMTKAAILGNHDSWNTQEFSKKRKDGVQLQLECLGDEHVGYKRLDYPTLKLSLVGGRPFSCGGDRLFRKRLVQARYGINDMDESAKRIHRAASGAPEDHFIIFLAHNGPTGLGSNMNDICGKDWVYGGGDHGDPDLAQAISLVKTTAKRPVPLVVFGHMHKGLRYGGHRKMLSVGNNTVYVNGAVVPRVKRVEDEQGTSGTIRAFTLIELSAGKIAKIAETWISVVGDSTSLKEEFVLCKGSIESTE